MSVFREWLEGGTFCQTVGGVGGVTTKSQSGSWGGLYPQDIAEGVSFFRVS